MDLRMQELPLELNGKVYNLRCNYGVLADLDVYGGIIKVLKSGTFKAAQTLMVVMLNDWAKRNGSDEMFTTAKLSEMLESYKGNYMQLTTQIIEFVTDSLVDKTETEPEKAENEDDSKN